MPAPIELPRPFLWLADTLCIVVSFLLTPQLDQHRPLHQMAWMLAVMWSVSVVSLQGFGAYRPLLAQSRARLILAAVLAPCIGLSAITLILFSLHEPDWSRLFPFLFTAVTAFSLVTWRSAVRWYRNRRRVSGAYARAVTFVGAPDSVRWLRRYFERTISPNDYRVVGWFSVDASLPPGSEREPLPLLGGVGQIGDVLVHQPIHEIVAIESTGGSAWLADLISVCDYFRITLRIVPEALLSGRPRDLEIRYHSDRLRLPEVVLSPHALDSDALFFKRVLDIVLSAIGLLVLSPLFGLIALLIKITTPGLPLFYRWRVIGFNGVPFTGYKFTTMVIDADARRHDLLSRNEMTGPVFKIKEDPRVTPLGRILRKYSLNELPQLWSVLKGDMSLVGPRPAFPHELERYELWHKRKLCVRPGITCLWQIRGRNRISQFDDWVRMDLEYIDNWSLWLDCTVLIRTFWIVITGTGS